MTTTTDKIAYDTSTAITQTLASLPSSSTAGRGCTPVVNTTNLYDDSEMTIAVKTSASALANDKTTYVYPCISEDGTIFDGSSAEAELSDAAVTFDSPTNLRGPVAISCPAVSTTYRRVISLALFLGGLMGRKWGEVLQNYTGQNLDSTEGNHTKQYSGIWYTNS